MAKWNKSTFISCTKENCAPRVQTTVMDLVKFAEEDADQVSEKEVSADQHSLKKNLTKKK